MKTVLKKETPKNLPFSFERLKTAFPNWSVHPMMMEQQIFYMADQFTKSTGGVWRMTTVDDYIIVIPPIGKYEVKVKTNNYRGTMDQLTFGAALTLLIQFNLVCQLHDNGADSELLKEQTAIAYSLQKAVVKDERFDYTAIHRFLD